LSDLATGSIAADGTDMADGGPGYVYFGYSDTSIAKCTPYLAGTVVLGCTSTLTTYSTSYSNGDIQLGPSNLYWLYGNTLLFAPK
jgi:hypothetical protein